MPNAQSGDVSIYYDTFGFDDGPALVLLCGLGSQVLFWHEEFCYSLVDRGFFVVRVDNREAGLSGDVPGEADYTLSDMADDVIAVLDALGLAAAHVCGQSLGGMIAQHVALEHPERVLSLASISSSTGNLEFGKPTDEAFAALTESPPTTRDEQIERDIANRRIWASPSWFDDDLAREYFTASYDRAYRPMAGVRHFAALLASGSRDAALPELKMPALVVHGALDPLISPDGGRHTASLIPGAELLMIEGMGHDLPMQVWQQVISAITALAARVASED